MAAPLAVEAAASALALRFFADLDSMGAVDAEDMAMYDIDRQRDFTRVEGKGVKEAGIL